MSVYKKISSLSFWFFSISTIQWIRQKIKIPFEIKPPLTKPLTPLCKGNTIVVPCAVLYKIKVVSHRKVS